MTKLARRENFFDDLFDLRRDFDELFHRLMTGWPWSTEPTARMLALAPPVEAWVDSKAKRYHLRVALLPVLLQDLIFSGLRPLRPAHAFRVPNNFARTNGEQASQLLIACEPSVAGIDESKCSPLELQHGDVRGRAHRQSAEFWTANCSR